MEGFRSLPRIRGSRWQVPRRRPRIFPWDRPGAEIFPRPERPARMHQQNVEALRASPVHQNAGASFGHQTITQVDRRKREACDRPAPYSFAAPLRLIASLASLITSAGIA